MVEQHTTPLQPEQSILVQSSVVVLANDINQSIFNPIWLVSNGILIENEFRFDEALFVPGLTRINTGKFEFMALPDRIQLQFPKFIDDADSLLTRVLIGITKMLPHTPFKAIGLNNQFRLKPTDAAQFSEWNLRTFASPWALSHTHKHPRDKFGCTFAYDAFDGARMRIRAAVSAESNPNANATSTEEVTTPYVVDLHCNLHRDLQLPGVTPLKELPRMVSLWKKVYEETSQIAVSLIS